MSIFLNPGPYTGRVRSRTLACTGYQPNAMSSLVQILIFIDMKIPLQHKKNSMRKIRKSYGKNSRLLSRFDLSKAFEFSEIEIESAI